MDFLVGSKSVAKLGIPDKMKQWTLWALWVLLIASAIVWVLVGSVSYWVLHGWLPPDTSGWAQFCGAMLALVVAVFAPIWHSAVVTRQRQLDNQLLVSALADSAIEALWLQSHSFINVDTELSNMRSFLRHRRERQWEVLARSVDQLPMAEMSPATARDLQVLREAVGFGGYVASQMHDWVKNGSSRPDDVITLRSKRDLLVLVRARMPGKVERSHAQEAGLIHENKRPLLNPFGYRDVSIYRRYSWSPANRKAPVKVQVQLVFPFGADHPLTYELTVEEMKWQSLDQAEGIVWCSAVEVIDREDAYS